MQFLDTRNDDFQAELKALLAFETAQDPLMNVKAAPDLVQTLRVQTGFLPAYHMNKTHWLSIRLDGSADEETVKTLLDGSFLLTGRFG